MQRWRSRSDIPPDWGRCVVAIGVFDGVHLGHAELITRASHEAHERGLPTVVVTFDPHPGAVLSPGHGPAALTTPARRTDLLQALGATGVLMLEFTPELARLSPEAFVADILAGDLHAEVVVVGSNFTFGYRAQGTVADLDRLGRAFGMTVITLPLSARGDTPVSSTRIRNALVDGEVDEVARLLGRPYRADGVVVRGEQRGRALGYPTANLDMAPGSAVPADGVYAGRVVRLNPDGSHSGEPDLGVGAISVGTNPTFDGADRTVEVFILDFDADLYGDVLGVEFWHRLRGQVRFDSIEALVEQMDADVARTRELIKYF